MISQSFFPSIASETAMQSLGHLSRSEKLRMMEALWCDLSRDESALPSPAWHGDALRDAEVAHTQGEAGFIDWGEAKKRLLSD